MAIPNAREWFIINPRLSCVPSMNKGGTGYWLAIPRTQRRWCIIRIQILEQYASKPRTSRVTLLTSYGIILHMLLTIDLSPALPRTWIGVRLFIKFMTVFNFFDPKVTYYATKCTARAIHQWKPASRPPYRPLLANIFRIETLFSAFARF